MMSTIGMSEQIGGSEEGHEYLIGNVGEQIGGNENDEKPIGGMWMKKLVRNMREHVRETEKENGGEHCREKLRDKGKQP